MARTPQRTLSQDFIVTDGDAITGDDTTGSDGGDLILEGGDATGSSNGDAGDVLVRPGTPDGSGARGIVNVTNNGGADTVPVLQLTSEGSNGEDVRVLVGTRDPSATVSANPGDLYVRHNGASSSLSINTGASDGNTTWTAAAGGGGSALNFLVPRVAPDSPHADDEEFNDNTSVNNMTIFDPASLGVTRTLSYNRIAVLVPNNSPARNVGVVKAVPSGSWTAWTRVSMTGQAPTAGGTFATFSLSLLDSNAISSPTIASIWKLAMTWVNGGVSGSVVVQRWGSHGSFTGNDYQNDHWPATFTHLYFRIRYNSGTPRTSFDVSTDGEGWAQLYTTTSLFLTPAFVGFIGHVESGSLEDAIMYGDFLRFTSATNYDQVMLGKVV